MVIDSLRSSSWLILALMYLGALVAPATATAANSGAEPAQEVSGPDLIRNWCSGCHQETSPGQFYRISASRRTPEGWLMTMFRMRQLHGVTPPEDVRDRIVRYLADTQGLAPAESAAGRFALERRPNVRDLPVDPELDRMCGRCHTIARVALQRRTAEEWQKLVHMHVGQFPTLEYQASARDRHWWEIATTRLPGQLEAAYPYDSKEWREWRARVPADLAGRWIVVGRATGGRDFHGTAEIRGSPEDGYRAEYSLNDSDGKPLAGTSRAIVYTGYEWRGTAQLGGRETSEVYSLSPDATRLSGRWFLTEHAEDGGEWLAVRTSVDPQILAVLPQSLKVGTTTTVTIVGNGLAAGAAVTLGPEFSTRVLERTAERIMLQVSVPGDATIGYVPISVGTISGGRLAVYREVDRIEVLPGNAIARVGGGEVPPVVAQFEALGFSSVPGGAEIALGPVSAEWRAEPFDAEARRMKDDKYAGRIDPTGRFIPAAGGPNPERPMSTNNFGNLAIVARVQSGDRAIEGRSRLVVTGQRWNTPPIY